MLKKIIKSSRNKLMIIMIVGALLLVGLTSTLLFGETREYIRILGTVSFSGPAGNIGPAYDRAIKLAVEEINSEGIMGFAGIEYKVIDIETKPSVLLRKLGREAATWKPDVMGGAALETTIRPLCTEAPKLKIPAFVGGHLSMSKYMPPGEVPVTKWVVYYGYADYFAGQLAGKFFHEMGAKKVGIIAGDYDWGYSNSMGLKAYWEKAGRPFEIAPIIYTPLDKTDYSTEAMIVKRENPDAIFCPYTGAGWFTVPTQLRDAGAIPEIFLYGTTYSNLGGAIITGEYGAKNIYTLADHDPTSDAWKKFVRKWKVKYGELAFPEAYTNNYYQVIHWIKEVYEKAQTKDPDVIIDLMQETSFQNVCISPMGPLDGFGNNWGAKGAIIRFVPGASELHPVFGLHEELVGVYETPRLTMHQILEEMKGMTRLEPGTSYPMAR
ncbi:MAG: ABC transporter substrate-binding protein [Candidatus Jordarchaeum sp.]|uniref:ABC transporter substrate-binding protein n=1 Tax=Candidatus Jordarchaeum sp. TaxID=2823881 RepID=UPI00404AF68E